MAYFALLWKARTIEKYRRNYETEKIKSISMSNTQIPKQSLSQRWRHYRYDTQKRISKTFRSVYPEGSALSNFVYYLKTDQTFPNFVMKSVVGFLGGIVLTYLCFMFFVFQLSISLIHATIMSSIIGVLLTLGLAFSYRIRCLVFLLIPQFFSRVGRYSLTCYALVLILTGPATNTLKNSEVLSESLACGQEQIKSSVNQLNYLKTKPLNSMKDSIKLMIDRLQNMAFKVKQLTLKFNRLVLNIAQVIQSGFLWLNSLSSICQKKLGTPYQQCMDMASLNSQEFKNLDKSGHCAERAKKVCSKLKPKLICVLMEHLNGDIVSVIKKRLRNFSERITHIFKMKVHIHHSYSFSSNTSRSASQAAAGIVTEIRRRADPLLTWLSWSSCVTSLFLLLIIFRAKNYQHMFETRSRFDNRYITKEIRDLDLKRLREGRETILPLNRRERAKYVTTTSFRLVASEKVYLNRSVVFMAITTFKLLVHMVADYSLYWVLMTVRYHGRFQTALHPGPPYAGMIISGSGPTADILRSILASFCVLLDFPPSAPVSCLPNPYTPDLKRYTQIGILIFLLWFSAMFEPYGLRLRHVIMGHYQPERAKSRAVWLYNHILRTRGGFMKFARRKLHRTYKYRSEDKFTFQRWLSRLIPFPCLRSFLGVCPDEPHCLLCGTIRYGPKSDTELVRCKTSNCPGIYCASCFADIGDLCTICLSPKDYGDLSDVSLEKGSSDESDDDDRDSGSKMGNNTNYSLCDTEDTTFVSSNRALDDYRKRVSSKDTKTEQHERMLLLPTINQRTEKDFKYNDKDLVETKSPVKKLTRLRHRKHILHRKKCFENEPEYDVTLRKYCRVTSLDGFEISVKPFGFYNLLEPQYEFKGYSVTILNVATKVGTNENAGSHSNDKYSDDNTFKNINNRTRFNQNNKTVQKNKRRVCKTLSNLMVKSRRYNIHLLRKFTDKDVLKNYAMNPGAATKRRKRPNSGPFRLKGQKCAKSTSLIIMNCGKKITKSFVVNSCHCNCDHSDIINYDKFNKEKRKTSKNKKTQENLDSKSSERSCICLKKIRSFFMDVMNIFRTNVRITSFSSTSVNKRKSPPSGDKKNHKRRKKKCKEQTKKLEDSDVKNEVLSSDDSRNYRISAYLDDQDWIKRQCGCKAGCDKAKMETCGGSDVSEALAVIKSRSRNFALKNRCYDGKERSLRSKVNRRAVDKHTTLKNNRVKKNDFTFSELWKRIGYGFMSDSSSTSFLKNVYRKTNEIFANDRGKTSKTSSPELLSRRLKFYESLGNDDFDRILKENSALSLDSCVPIKTEGISVSKYPINNELENKSQVISGSNIKADCRRLSNASICKTLRHLKGSLTDHINSSCENSLTFIKNLCCKKSTKGKENETKIPNETSGDIKSGKVESFIEITDAMDSKVENSSPGKKGINHDINRDKTDGMRNKMGNKAAETKANLEEKNIVNKKDVGNDARVALLVDAKIGSDEIKLGQMTCSPGCSGMVQKIEKPETATVKPRDDPMKFKEKSTMTTAHEDLKVKNSNSIGVMVEPFAYQPQQSTATDGTQALCGCEKLIKLLEDRGSLQVNQREKVKSMHAEEPVVGNQKKNVPAPSSQEDSVMTMESNCPCDGTCDAGTKEKTCTCATQYLHSDGDSSSQMRLLREFISIPDENLDKEIYEFTSISCFDSKEQFSSSINNDDDSEPCTDPTVCNLAYMDNPRRKFRRKEVYVVTKANQSTTTEKLRLCDVSTSTQDWWSPILVKRKNDKDRRFNRIVKHIGSRELRYDVMKDIDRELVFGSAKEILLEKKEGGYIMSDQRRETKKRTKVTMTDGRTVKFKSQAQIIPAGVEDILSPSRYLLESQRYYNELFCTKVYAPHLFPVNAIQTPVWSRNRSPHLTQRQTRRNHKTKRLEECYSPYKQVISPRRRCMGFEWIRANNSGDSKCQRKIIQRSNKPSNSSKIKRTQRGVKIIRVVVNQKPEQIESESIKKDTSLDVRCNSNSSF